MLFRKKYILPAKIKKQMDKNLEDTLKEYAISAGVGAATFIGTYCLMKGDVYFTGATTLSSMAVTSFTRETAKRYKTNREFPGRSEVLARLILPVGTYFAFFGLLSYLNR